MYPSSLSNKSLSQILVFRVFSTLMSSVFSTAGSLIATLNHLLDVVTSPRTTLKGFQWLIFIANWVKNQPGERGVVVHTFSPRTQEAGRSL